MPKLMPTDFEPEDARLNRDVEFCAQRLDRWIEFSAEELVKYSGAENARSCFSSGARYRGLGYETKKAPDLDSTPVGEKLLVKFFKKESDDQPGTE